VISERLNVASSQLLINAVTGEVSSGTQVAGYPPSQRLYRILASW